LEEELEEDDEGEVVVVLELEEREECLFSFSRSAEKAEKGKGG
jgi:hypothetical protein